MYGPDSSPHTYILHFVLAKNIRCGPLGCIVHAEKHLYIVQAVNGVTLKMGGAGGVQTCSIYSTLAQSREYDRLPRN